MTKGGLRWTEEQLADYQKRHRNMPEKCQPGPVHDFFMQTETKSSKFHSVLTECDGIKFHSKKEARVYRELQARVHMGELKFILRQIPFDLPGHATHRIDFMLVKPDFTVEFLEVKGRDLPMGKLKRKMVEELYGIQIGVV